MILLKWRASSHVYAREMSYHSSISMEGVQGSQCAMDVSCVLFGFDSLNSLSRPCGNCIGSSLGAIQSSAHICHWHHVLARSP